MFIHPYSLFYVAGCVDPATWQLAAVMAATARSNSSQESPVMWLKHCRKLAMTGNGAKIPPIKMVMSGGWFMALF